MNSTKYKGVCEVNVPGYFGGINEYAHFLQHQERYFKKFLPYPPPNVSAKPDGVLSGGGSNEIVPHMWDPKFHYYKVPGPRTEEIQTNKDPERRLNSKTDPAAKPGSYSADVDYEHVIDLNISNMLHLSYGSDSGGSNNSNCSQPIVGNKQDSAVQRNIGTTTCGNQEFPQPLNTGPVAFPDVRIGPCIVTSGAETEGNVSEHYVCSTCGKSYSDKVSLNAHAKSHSAFMCRVCGKKCSTKEELDEHNNTHSENPYICYVCGKSFSDRLCWDTHLNTHTKERLDGGYAECGPSFPNRINTVQQSKGYRKTPHFLCSICGMSFRDKVTHDNHKCQSGNRPYACNVCGRAFRHNGTLVVHVRTHTGERPYSCGICSKAFSQKSALKCHARLHTGEKPYSCTICGKCFTVKGSLIVHTRVHTKEKPYECEVCGKSFSQKNTLDAHARHHSGEKPFTCNICGKSFAQKISLKVHGKNHVSDASTTT